MPPITSTKSFKHCEILNNDSLRWSHCSPWLFIIMIWLIMAKYLLCLSLIELCDELLLLFSWKMFFLWALNIEQRMILNKSSSASSTSHWPHMNYGTSHVLDSRLCTLHPTLAMAEEHQATPPFKHTKTKFYIIFLVQEWQQWKMATASNYVLLTWYLNASLPMHSQSEESEVFPLKIQCFLTMEHLFSFCVHCSLLIPEWLAILTFLFKSSLTTKCLCSMILCFI